MIRQFVNWFAPRNIWHATGVFALWVVLFDLTFLGVIWGYGMWDTAELSTHLAIATTLVFPFLYLSLAMLREQVILQEKITHMASTDMLTKLPNRRAFLEAVQDAMPDRQGYLMMLDIDHFKQINDAYGHSAGDVCLAAMAQHLQYLVRRADLVARLGGEEFGIYLRGGNPVLLDQLGRKMARGIKIDLAESGVGLRITNSIGATATGDISDVHELLLRADRALYQAKAAGRARMVIANETTIVPFHKAETLHQDDKAKVS